MTRAPVSPIANPWQSHPVRVQAIEAEIPGVATYELGFEDLHQSDQYDCLPGQFNMLYLPGVGEVAISVSGRRASNAWMHTIRTAGNTTRALERLGLGGCLGLRGPFGTVWPLVEHQGADVILLAGGIGLAPLRPAVEYLLEHRAAFGRLTLIYGARSPDTLLYRRQYSDWIARGMQVQVTVDRATPHWTGNIGVVPLLFDRLRPLVPGNSVVFSCGPEVMMRYAMRSAFQRGLQGEQVFLSLERNMQCAVGLCGHCQLGPAFICRDGPVFRYDRIAPFLSIEAL